MARRRHAGRGSRQIEDVADDEDDLADSARMAKHLRSSEKALARLGVESNGDAQRKAKELQIYKHPTQLAKFAFGGQSYGLAQYALNKVKSVEHLVIRRFMDFELFFKGQKGGGDMSAEMFARFHVFWDDAIQAVVQSKGSSPWMLYGLRAYQTWTVSVRGYMYTSSLT